MEEDYYNHTFESPATTPREDDVCDALAFYDAAGTRARRRGPDKRRKDGKFITTRSRFPLVP